MTRAEKAAAVARMRSEGALFREIADALGISPSYARDLSVDPDLSKARARKARHAGQCLDCGKPTDGSSGRARAPKRCAACAARYQAANATWTEEAIVEAIRLFHSLKGRPPIANEFSTVSPHAGAPEPVEWLPAYATVQKVFGTISAATAAAGFKPNPVGRYVLRPRPGDSSEAS